MADQNNTAGGEVQDRVSPVTEQGFDDLYLKDDAAPEPAPELADTSLVVSFIDYDVPCSKAFSFANGKWAKEELYRSNNGVAHAITYETFEDFAADRLQRTAVSLQVMGTFALENDGAACRYGGKNAEGEVAGTANYIAFRKAPGDLVIDTDVKWPHEVAGLFPEQPRTWATPEAWLETLFEAIPELADVPHLCMDSTSARLRVAGKMRKAEDGGFHTHIPVDSAADIPEIGDRIYGRLLAAGLGWGFVAKDGQIHVRTPFDIALAKSPAQPNFCAAKYSPPIERDRRHVLKITGARLVGPEAIAWSKEHIAAAKTAERVIRGALAEKANEVMAVHHRGVARTILRNKGNVTEAEVSETIALLKSGTLSCGMEITFSDGKSIGVRELLLGAGAKYDNAICADPLLPDYDGGRMVAKFFWNKGCPAINSFAHGKHTLFLRYDEESFPTDLDIDGTVRALSALQTSKAKFDAILNAAAKRLRVNKTAIMEDVEAIVVKLPEDDFAEELSSNGWRPPRPDHDPNDATVYPEDEPLPLDLFPHIKSTQRRTWPIMHMSNVKVLLRAYNLTMRYNLITKDVETNHVGSDNSENALRARVLGMCHLNDMPVEGLDTMLMGIVDANTCNPVTEYLSRLQWDGVPRIQCFADAMSQDPTREIALRLHMIGACAAADSAELGMLANPLARPTFEYVMVLVGMQGAKKTSTLVGMAPAPLRQYVKAGVMLKIGDKDSEKAAISAWMVEFGELESTFRKSEITDMKAFLSRQRDELRMPFAPKASRYPRRTQFMGSVNGMNFLRDNTGNRRYMPVVTMAMPQWPDQEIEQMWAEAWAMYVSGRQWWPTLEEEGLLFAKAAAHTESSQTEDLLRRKYDWSDLTTVQDSNRWPPGMIFNAIHGRPGNDKLTVQESAHAGEVLRKLWGIQSGGNRKVRVLEGHQAGTMIEVYATGGKNFGYLLPALRDGQTHGGPVSGFEKKD